MTTQNPGSTVPTSPMIGDAEFKVDPSDQVKSPAQPVPEQVLPDLFSKPTQSLEFVLEDPENIKKKLSEPD